MSFPGFARRWSLVISSAILTGFSIDIGSTILIRSAMAQGSGPPCFATVGENPGTTTPTTTYSTGGGSNAPSGPGYYGTFTSFLTYTCGPGSDYGYCGACDVTYINSGSKLVNTLRASNAGSCNATNKFDTVTYVGPIPAATTYNAVSVLIPWGNPNTCGGSASGQQYDVRNVTNPNN